MGVVDMGDSYDDYMEEDYEPLPKQSLLEHILGLVWGVFPMLYFLGFALFLAWCVRHAVEQSFAGGAMFFSSLMLMGFGGLTGLAALLAEYDWKDKPQNRRLFVRNWVAIPLIAGI